MQISGGKSVYGASVGFLLLESRFPRIPGDAGNASSWPFPVLYQVVPGASPRRVVTQRAAGLEDAFIAGARALIRAGADGIVTNCGFLSLLQHRLAGAVGAPVLSSPLLQVPMLARMIPAGRRVGILTVDASSLGDDHLRAAGIDGPVAIEGSESGKAFSRMILDDLPECDVDTCREDLVAAALRLRSKEPRLGAIVLECTNMTPFARAIAAASGLPVFSMYSMVCWFQSGLSPRRFPLETTSLP